MGNQLRLMFDATAERVCRTMKTDTRAAPEYPVGDAVILPGTVTGRNGWDFLDRLAHGPQKPWRRVIWTAVGALALLGILVLLGVRCLGLDIVLGLMMGGLRILGG